MTDDYDALTAELAEVRALYVQTQEDINAVVGRVVALRAKPAEARALYVQAQEDLNGAVGNVVALRAELAAAQAAWLVEINKVARVRGLCDADPYGLVAMTVRAALEGNQT